MKAFLRNIILVILVVVSWSAPAVTRYVDLNSLEPTPPYTNWFTAATVIQDAVDVAKPGDEILVTNGVYQSGGAYVGGLLKSRLAITKPITVRSVNGADVTLIKGYQVPGSVNDDDAVRGVFLANGATLAGFKILNGATRSGGLFQTNSDYVGGGVYCNSADTTVSNCIVIGNAAESAGGGMFGGVLKNSTIQNNFSSYVGGGAYGSSLSNCMVIYNAATNYGGGVDSCVLAGCNVNSNLVVRFGGGGASYSKLRDSRLTGNIAIEASGGGAHSCAMTNCSLDYNQAQQFGGGTYAGTLTNCALLRNSANYGGGASSAQLFDCTLTENSAVGIGGGGGGAYDSVLFSCQLQTNSTASSGGGGGSYCTFNSCLLIGNVANHALGGGALWSVLNESTLIGNLAHSGGGAYDSDLSNCSVVGNSAANGGGAMYCDLYGCTVVGNSALGGGGLVKGTAQNTIIYFNSAANGTNYGGNLAAPVLNYCCTSPLPLGTGNIADIPLFEDLASNDLRLQSNSPCINAGNTSIPPSLFDQLGNPRVSGGAQDMGAYEFQGPTSILSYAWAQKNGLPTDGSADFTDPDADGMNNYGEWRADTIPTNALSVLRLLGLTNSTIGVAVTWQSVSTRVYGLERTTNLISPVIFELVDFVQGSSGTTTYSDAAATNSGPYFYRVMVQ